MVFKFVYICLKKKKKRFLASITLSNYKDALNVLLKLLKRLFLFLPIFPKDVFNFMCLLFTKKKVLSSLVNLPYLQNIITYSDLLYPLPFDFHKYNVA
jgi:hypothetical protein